MGLAGPTNIIASPVPAKRPKQTKRCLLNVLSGVASTMPSVIVMNLVGIDLVPELCEEPRVNDIGFVIVWISIRPVIHASCV